MFYVSIMVTTKQKSKTESQEGISIQLCIIINSQRKAAIEKKMTKQSENNKMASVSPYVDYQKCKQTKFSNQKAQSDWMDKKIRSRYMLPIQETHFRFKDTHRLKVKGWKRAFHTSGNQKRAGVTILTSHITDQETRDTGRYIMMKGS